MLRIEKKSSQFVDPATGKAVAVEEVVLEGEINQDSDFAGQIKVDGKRVLVNCKGIRAINSVGVKHWISFFNGLRQQKVEIHFTECSCPMVYQINLMPNYALLQEVDSFYSTFLCEKCENEEQVLLFPKKLDPKNLVLPQVACSKCGGSCDLDELPAEYFNFLGYTE